MTIGATPVLIIVSWATFTTLWGCCRVRAWAWRCGL